MNDVIIFLGIVSSIVFVFYMAVLIAEKICFVPLERTKKELELKKLEAEIEDLNAMKRKKD